MFPLKVAFPPFAALPVCGGSSGRKTWPRPKPLRAIQNFAGNGMTGGAADCRRSTKSQATIALAEDANARLITQNVDGLHQRAGSKNVVEVHGSIWLLRCTKCKREWHDLSPCCSNSAALRVRGNGAAGRGLVWRELESQSLGGGGACGYDVRRFHWWPERRPLFIRRLGLAPLARAAGAKVIEVNLEATPLSRSVDYSFSGSSGVILPQLLDR